MKKYMITLKDRVYEVEIEEITGEEELTITKDSTPVKSNSSAQSLEGTAVEAPMSGNIWDVPVKVGDEVKKDQVLVVLEAMKMENEIVSPVEGKVISLCVSKGQKVDAGHVLLQIG